MGYDGGLLSYFGLDVGCLVSCVTYEAVHISGAGGDLEAEVVKSCLGALEHRGFHYQYRFGRFREVSPCRPFS